MLTVKVRFTFSEYAVRRHTSSMASSAMVLHSSGARQAFYVMHDCRWAPVKFFGTLPFRLSFDSDSVIRKRNHDGIIFVAGTNYDLGRVLRSICGIAEQVHEHAFTSGSHRPIPRRCRLRILRQSALRAIFRNSLNSARRLQSRAGVVRRLSRGAVQCVLFQMAGLQYAFDVAVHAPVFFLMISLYCRMRSGSAKFRGSSTESAANEMEAMGVLNSWVVL